jgi:hypothetical protein
MAVSGTGLSTSHEPAASGPLDPVWLASLAALLLLSWRAADRLWKREPEGAFLAWALLAYLPVCGLFVPLGYPMADRYLYFILPGLIGAALLAAPTAAEKPILAVGAAMLAWFAFASFERAAVWQTPAGVYADSAKNYPEGSVVTLARAASAAQSGDSTEALKHLYLARERGYARIDLLMSNPAYDPIRNDPEFRALIFELAEAQLERLEASETPSQMELFSIALMYEIRGETGRAVAALERASAEGGPIGPLVEDKLRNLRSSE